MPLVSGQRSRIRESLVAYAYIAPAAIILGAFCLYPLCYVFVMSLTRYWVTDNVQFVGLANYARLLFRGDFFDSFRITVFYAIGTIPVTLILSFLIANLLFQKLRGLGLYRTVYFLPYITSTVAAAMVWAWIFHPDGRGVANQILGFFGLSIQHWVEEPRGILQILISDGLPSWAAGPSMALVCVMIFSVWHSLGFCTVIFLAGLTTVPRELYEAADIDGAGWWTKLRRITLPVVSPTAFFLLVISTIRSFQTFNEVYMMAPSQKLDTCRNVTMEIYLNFWHYQNYGYAAAVAFVLFLIVMLLTVFQLRVVGRRVHY